MVSLDKQMEQIYEKVVGYQQDPVGFYKDVLSMRPEYIWHKMAEVAEAVRDNQFVCVRAGHFVSKTYGAGRLSTWFKVCYQPSTVVTTAPSDNLVRNQLWREIHAAYVGAKVPLGGKMTTLMWDVKPSEDILKTLTPEQREMWEKNFAIGFSTSPDSATEHATKMQGWHNEWVLVIIDEACGIAPQIWKTAVEALINDEQCKFLAIGNPTDPESEFAKACYSSDPEKNEGNESYISDKGYYVITISAKDTPNYKQGKQIIPGLASREWVERIEEKYGKDGDGYRYRVLGLFPTYKEGTYFGKYLAQARKDKRVGAFGYDPDAPVYTFTDFGDRWTATIFAQFIRGRIRIIDDYFDNDGQGLPFWVKSCKNKPYIYDGHYCSPELQSGSPGRLQTGKATTDLAMGLKFELTPVDMLSFNGGIDLARDIWNLLDINEPKCGKFLWAAAGYGKKKNMALSTDDDVAYHQHPALTPHRHMMDAYRYLAIAYRYHVIGDDILGYQGAIPEWQGKVDQGVGVGDLL